jgi:uncharacterized membrane protein YedE/YeeE
VKRFYTLIVGILFGIILVKSEVISVLRIQKMFRFEEAHMYLVIGSAVVVGAISVFLIKRFELKTVTGEPISIKEKKFQKGTVFGGLLYGAGWAISGSCPGPVYAQIGSGAYIAIITFLAAIGGVYLYAFLEPKLPH